MLAYLVEGSCRIKRSVVEEDPREQGIRAILNYGHTFGHAVESLMDFQLAHGECVAIGCMLSAAISCARGYITREEEKEIRELFAFFAFPALPKQLAPEKIIEELRHDKKMENGVIKFILLDAVGQAGIHQDVTREEMIGAFREKEEEA